MPDGGECGVDDRDVEYDEDLRDQREDEDRPRSPLAVCDLDRRQRVRRRAHCTHTRVSTALAGRAQVREPAINGAIDPTPASSRVTRLLRKRSQKSDARRALGAKAWDVLGSMTDTGRSSIVRLGTPPSARSLCVASVKPPG